MNKQKLRYLERLEKQAEEKYKKRDKKKKLKMKVSGGNVKKLSEIISRNYNP